MNANAGATPRRTDNIATSEVSRADEEEAAGQQQRQKEHSRKRRSQPLSGRAYYAEHAPKDACARLDQSDHPINGGGSGVAILGVDGVGVSMRIRSAAQPK